MVELIHTKEFCLPSYFRRGLRGGNTMTSQIHNRKDLKVYRKRLRLNSTDAEKILWLHLKNKQLGFKFRRQHSVGNYILDFYCPVKKLAIELDGGQHNERHIKKYDRKRTDFLKKLNIKVKRYGNNQVLVNTDSVLEDILKELNSLYNPSCTSPKLEEE